MSVGSPVPDYIPSPSSLFSPEVRAYPFDFYRWLRKEAPVCPGGPMGAFLVSRYADVARILRDPVVFSSSIMAPADPVLLSADPPRHHRVRTAVAHAIGALTGAAIEPTLRAYSRALVDAMSRRQTADLVGDFATPLPVFAIAQLLGLPDSRHRDLRRWADAVVAASTGRARSDPGLSALLLEMQSSLHALVSERLRPEQRDHPDFLSLLLHGPSPLAAEEAVAIASLFVVAGSETTTHLIGNAVLALAEHPDHLYRLRAGTIQPSDVIDETLRFDSPVQVLQRLCTVDTVISGVRVPAGATILLLLGSANRDEEQFPKPEVFDPTRRAGPSAFAHLAFGGGPHACVGATLARMEAVLALEALFAPNNEFSLLADPAPSLTPAVQLRGRSQIRLEFGSRNAVTSS
jgi:cytochrome P450